MNAPSSEWVSLREAANMLGVHPATVRNWADRGDLPMRRTPGGHRRFRREDLQQWLETRQSPPPAEIQMLIQNAMGKMRMHVSDGQMQRLGWYASMDEAARQTMRDKGREMLEALQRYLVEPPDTDDPNGFVYKIGESYARFLIGQGLSLSQAIEGFLVFSNFLQEAALNIVEVINVRPPTEWVTLLRQVREFNNDLLLGLIRIYEGREDQP